MPSYSSKPMPSTSRFAWQPEHVADRLLACMARGDFYVICPDNETTEEMDHARMQWNLDDIVKKRPALSRWHADYKREFEESMAKIGD